MRPYPDETQIKTLEEISLQMHQGLNTVTEKIQYLEDGYPIIQSKHITQGKLDLSDTKFVGGADFQKYKDKYNPKRNDILICNIGTIGKSLLVAKEVDFLIAWNVFLIRLDETKVCPGYCKYYLDHLSSKNYFDQFLTGGTVKFVNKGTLGATPIPLPSLPGQRRIAAILDQAEALRAKRRHTLAQLDTLTQTLFLDLFGDPVANQKGWRRMPFAELLTGIDSGWSPTCLDRPVAGDEWGVLKLGAVTWCEYNPAENKALPLHMEPDPSLEVKRGDLLFTRKNTYELVAACALVRETPPRLLMSDLNGAS